MFTNHATGETVSELPQPSTQNGLAVSLLSGTLVQPRQLRRYKYLYNIGIHFVTGHRIFQCFGSIFIVPDLAKNLNLDLAKI